MAPDARCWVSGRKRPSGSSFTKSRSRPSSHAIENPRSVNMDLVNAQQARRVLDRLVGFELSPVPVEEGASVAFGRPRAERRRAAASSSANARSSPSVVRPIPRRSPSSMPPAITTSTMRSRPSCTTRFETARGGRGSSSAKLHRRHFHGGQGRSRSPSQHFPAPPFTTSTLQQEAGRKLGMSVSQTMSVAQHLYEQGLHHLHAYRLGEPFESGPCGGEGGGNRTVRGRIFRSA